jgi:hypothetical protein
VLGNSKDSLWFKISTELPPRDRETSETKSQTLEGLLGARNFPGPLLIASQFLNLVVNWEGEAQKLNVELLRMPTSFRPGGYAQGWTSQCPRAQHLGSYSTVT